MKSADVAPLLVNTNPKADVRKEQKKFPGKPLDESVFKDKFDAANKVGSNIKGFKK